LSIVDSGYDPFSVRKGEQPRAYAYHTYRRQLRAAGITLHVPRLRHHLVPQTHHMITL